MKWLKDCLIFIMRIVRLEWQLVCSHLAPRYHLLCNSWWHDDEEIPLKHFPITAVLCVEDQGGTGFQGFNSFWPGDTIWQHRSGSALAQVMAPSHYLNQCWPMTREVLWHSLEGNFTGNAQDTLRFVAVSWRSSRAGRAKRFAAGGRTNFYTKDPIVLEVSQSSPFRRPAWLRTVSRNVNPWYELKNHWFKIRVISPRGQWIKQAVSYWSVNGAALFLKWSKFYNIQFYYFYFLLYHTIMPHMKYHVVTAEQRKMWIGNSAYNSGDNCRKLLVVWVTSHVGTGLILGLRPANERRRYFVTTSLIGWAQA